MTTRILVAVRKAQGKKAQQTNSHPARIRMAQMKMTVKGQATSLMTMINLTKTKMMKITMVVSAISQVPPKCSKN